MAALLLRLGAAVNMAARLHSPFVAVNMAAPPHRGVGEAVNMATPCRRIHSFRISIELWARVRILLHIVQPHTVFFAGRLGT
ncbi:hypothetical protein HPB52_012217 [Rhipicephalus sanguineus]|uniref:Secreted protein n=1 Tax=Rhipicephalus sanguineus TaxID=34632 RepID=A0A9D4PVY8_RHISA|nr:hypothetical protein HPB52_012217 [Rhipicephalus sanguineus]